MSPVTRTLLAGAALFLAAPTAGQETAAPALSPRIFLPEAAQEPVRGDAEPAETPDAPAPLAPGAVPGGGPTFVLRDIRLEGARALGREELAPLWADLTGTPVSVPVLDELAARIGARYRAEGYVLSQALVPPQTIEDGVATIQVIEGFVDRVGVEGGREPAQAAAQRLFGPVAGSAPLRLGTLERSVILARDTLGGSVETVLAPAPDTFGAADLSVIVEPDPVAGFVNLDNRGSRLYDDGIAATAGATLWGPLGLNERWDVLVAGAPTDDSLRYGQLSLEVPLFALDGTWLDGARLGLAADASRARPDLEEVGSPEDLRLTLEETSAMASLIVPFIRTREQNLFAELALEYRESESTTAFAGLDDATTDRLVALAADLTWDRADRRGGVTLVDFSLRQGLDTGATDLEGPGDPAFTLAALSLRRLQRIGATPWSLYGEALGQLAFSDLPSSERFSLGGSTIGRGFAPGNNTGDSGLGARIELRRALGPELLGGGAAAELYAYGDWAEARDRDADRDGDRSESLASIGIGARIDIRPWLTITPEIARQIRGAPTDRQDQDRETRAFIGAIARF